MIEVFVFIWIVGALFTAGLNGAHNILPVIITIVAWPYVIGMIIRVHKTGV